MISGIVLAFKDDMTTVVTPAAVASSAAISFVSIPPVPSDVPSVAVETMSVCICQGVSV